MFKTDCFASGVNGKCGITALTNCTGCKFYKTHKQFRDDFKRSKQILQSRGYLDGAIEKYDVLKDMCEKIG